jgi:hypothetical protein
LGPAIKCYCPNQLWYTYPSKWPHLQHSPTCLFWNSATRSKYTYRINRHVSQEHFTQGLEKIKKHTNYNKFSLAGGAYKIPTLHSESNNVKKRVRKKYRINIITKIPRHYVNTITKAQRTYIYFFNIPTNVRNIYTLNSTTIHIKNT